MSSDSLYMQRAIQIAKNGLGTTAPNPMVGAVIVHNNRIIGEGYTSPYGGPHAEVNAINAVTDDSCLSKSTLYVTLEPCSHYGKTPPCADLIIQHKIPRVVIGIFDPNIEVSGKGIGRLKNAGCNVTIGLLEGVCRVLHKRFLTFHQKQRPYIILKWAETNDGFIAPKRTERSQDTQPYWISNEYSRQLVHKWRSEEQAILVGTLTVLDDNPKLNVRQWHGKSPIRVVLDRDLRIKDSYHILDQSVKTIIITQVSDKSQWIKGIDYEVIDFNKNTPQQINQVLYKHNITSVLIEGGAKTLQSFIDASLWDEARVITAKGSFGDGLKAPNLAGNVFLSKQVDSDILNMYTND